MSILTRKSNRPKGIVFIAILTLVSGLLSIFSGDVIFLILGIISIFMFYGLLKGREWAWSVTIIVSVFNIVASVTFLASSFFNFPIINSNNPIVLGSMILAYKIGINAIILYYLYRPHVKIFFGKSRWHRNITSFLFLLFCCAIPLLWGVGSKFDAIDDDEDESPKIPCPTYDTNPFHNALYGLGNFANLKKTFFANEHTYAIICSGYKNLS